MCGVSRTLHRRTHGEPEGSVAQERLKFRSSLSAVTGEGNVRPAGVLPGLTPLGFAMSDEN